MDPEERHNELSNLIDEFLNEVRENEDQKEGAKAIIKSVRDYLFGGKNINTVSDDFRDTALNIKEFITANPYVEGDNDIETYNDMASEALEEYNHGQEGGAYRRKSRRRRASHHRKARRKSSRKVSRRRITRRKMRRAH